ncbi:hypothetical protein WMY93_014632 [Mugilogobius chulae]|uniref:AIG1-type G domain-containing protein n=1 Tax=Mugilogobius chulae TaxID=88201 RepID=A0AAW0P5U2_9GOBI
MGNAESSSSPQTAAAADRRVVLLGKTGSGKSSLANTILESGSLFKVCHGSTSGTVKCQAQTKTVEGRNVQLIDTPGLLTPTQTPLILERFTKHELSVADVICQHFSKDIFNYTTVVFTLGDQLNGVTIKEWIKDNKLLSSLVQRCGGRCHVFDNKHWNDTQDPYRNNQVQLKELLNTIDQTVQKNGGRCYTNENLKTINEKVNEEKEKLKATPENANLSEEEINKKAKENTFQHFWPILKGWAQWELQ